MKKTQNSLKEKGVLRLFLSGMAMGSADIVPGVSGGTIALILGVYEQLISSIKLVSGKTLQLLLQGKIKPAIESVPWKFLVPLGLGLVTALLSLAKLVSFLLDFYPSYLWSFFFGLVLASVVFVAKKVSNWSSKTIGALLLSAVAAYFIVGLVPVETPTNLVAFFLSGVIAICAMILPGISGSFLLILMGKYSQILQAVNDKNILVILVFTSGTIVGISFFSRFLSWLFDNYHNVAMASLTGFMLGSLRKVWPWKVTLTTTLDSHGATIPLTQMNIWPPQLDISVFICIALMIIGIALIFGLSQTQE